MADESKAKSRLEIAHVLFIDIVGYSKLLTEEQSEALQELNQIVRNTEAARDAEAAGQLTILPTGDGMALVFTGSVEEPAECALEISHALRAQPSLPVRMGVHSGPVHHVKDANQRDNIAGVGINIAQRVMDCGDAGHILVSKRVADDLAQQRRWQPYLHELGDVEVKHGTVVSLVNFYAETIGNPSPPEGIGKGRGRTRAFSRTTRKGLSPFARAMFVLAGLFIALAIVAVIFTPAIMRSLGKNQTVSPLAPPPPPLPGVPPAPSSFTDTIKKDVAKKIQDELQNAFAQKKKAEDMAKANGVQPAGPSLPVPDKSIAVLPFENLSGDPDNAYFAAGIQEEIITRLSKVADLKVISRSSTQHFKSAPDDLPGIAAKLAVANILEGSVQRTGDQVRINVQLIKGSTDTHLWAETFDRKLNNIFGVESEIARTIAQTLQAKLTGSERSAINARPTQDTEAYELYLRGRFFWNKRSGPELRKAIDYFNQAIAKDPNYALAYAGLADSYLLLPNYGSASTQEAIVPARAALKKALELDDSLAEAHASSGLLDLIEVHLDPAITELKRAIELNPNYATAHHWLMFGQLALGHFDPAIAEGRRALELDPLSLIINADFAWALFSGRKFDEAETQARKTLEIDPNFFRVHSDLGEVLQFQGRLAEAIQEYRKAFELNKNPRSLGLLGQAQARFGQREAAEKILAHFNEQSNSRYISPYPVALVYLGLGQKEQAIDQLEHAFQSGETNYLFRLKIDPMLDDLRGNPRFEALVQKIVGPKSEANP
jgi:TolB-like protein/tetratricopeptide (TPR) repeat protein